MANPIAIAGSNVGSGSLITPGGAQGVQGIQGPTRVSADAANLSQLGSDNLIWTPRPVSANAGNMLVPGTDNLAFLANTSNRYFGQDTTNTGAYVVSVPTDFVLITGVIVWIQVKTNATANPTLNVNNTGVKSLLNRSGMAFLQQEVYGNRFHGVVYDGTSWRIFTPIGRNMTVGNVSAANVECQGFDGVALYYTINNNVTMGINLAHLAPGVPVSIAMYNGYSAGVSAWVQGSNPDGTAFGATYMITGNSITASNYVANLYSGFTAPTGMWLHLKGQYMSGVLIVG